MSGAGHAAARGSEWAARVRGEVQQAVVGQDAIIERALVALLADGHVLIEGMPGLAKTLLVKSLKAMAQHAPEANVNSLPGGLEAVQVALTESYDELLRLVVPEHSEVTVEYADEHMTSLDVLRFVKTVLQVNQLPLLRQEMLEIRGIALALVQDGAQLGLVETAGSESTTS